MQSALWLLQGSQHVSWEYHTWVIDVFMLDLLNKPILVLWYLDKCCTLFLLLIFLYKFEYGKLKCMINIYCLDLLYFYYYTNPTCILTLFLYFNKLVLINAFLYTKQTNTYKCSTLTTCNNNKTLKKIFQTDAYV